MKNMIKYFNIAVVLLLFSGALAIHAQQRAGGGGGININLGGGGGGGGGGFNNFNRNGGSSSSSSSTYNNNGTVGSATISVDPDTHNIIVIADEQTGDQISNVIANLDEPKPQVLIKVVFMEVENNNSLDLGVEGGWANSGSLNQSAGNVLGLSGLNSVVTNFNALGQPLASALSPGSSASPLANGGFYQIATSDFQATLKAVAEAGKAQILSRPSILARDGQLAQIVVGQQIYLPSGVSFTSVGTGSSTVPTINGSYQNVGIILDVTPYIGENNLVEMIVQPQTSSVDTSSPGQVIATGGLLGTPIYAPNLDIRSADTVVVTPDTQPVVIGGLIGDTKSSSDTKIPILGDIPLLGNFFKYTSRSDDKTELLIFLTPHIVQTPSQLAPLSVRERSQTPAINSSVSEQELDQFLERVPMKKNP
jgi:general secretion pathway protein D